MEELFTCERYKCSMKRKHCVRRLLPSKNPLNAVDPVCKGCAQGKEIAEQVGIRIVDFTGMLTCSKCGESKPVKAFSSKQGNRNSLDRTCKACRNLAQKERHFENMVNA